MDKRLLSILRCPVSHKGLAVVKQDRLAEINAAIDAGGLVNHEGTVITEHLSEALITDDGQRIYPVDDGIPVLLEDASIGAEQLA